MQHCPSSQRKDNAILLSNTQISCWYLYIKMFISSLYLCFFAIGGELCRRPGLVHAGAVHALGRVPRGNHQEIRHEAPHDTDHALPARCRKGLKSDSTVHFYVFWYLNISFSTVTFSRSKYNDITLFNMF